jgi:hypothetical protein
MGKKVKIKNFMTTLSQVQRTDENPTRVKETCSLGPQTVSSEDLNKASRRKGERERES